MIKGRSLERDTRTYVAELALVAVLIVAIYPFLMAGGPSAVGDIWAELIRAP
jgi:hypothetical protein